MLVFNRLPFYQIYSIFIRKLYIKSPLSYHSFCTVLQSFKIGTIISKEHIGEGVQHHAILAVLECIKTRELFAIINFEHMCTRTVVTTSPGHPYTSMCLQLHIPTMASKSTKASRTGSLVEVGRWITGLKLSQLVGTEGKLDLG